MKYPKLCVIDKNKNLQIEMDGWTDKQMAGWTDKQGLPPLNLIIYYLTV